MFAIADVRTINARMAAHLNDPERELALTYAPRDTRVHLRALWALDERFGSIVSRTTEATVGEMRLLWWRECLEKLEETIPEEPLLSQIAEAIEETGIAGAEAGAMAEGWHALLQEPMQMDDLRRYARERGGRLFRLSATILGDREKPELASLGEAWALSDLSFRVIDEKTAEKAIGMAAEIFGETSPSRWPSGLRALGALVVLARRDIRRGSATRRQGSPARVARMAWHRLTGK